MKHNNFKIYKKQKPMLYTLLYMVFPVILSFVIYSVGYGSEALLNLNDYLNVENPNIYLYKDTNEKFCKDDIEYINNNITLKSNPIYFSNPTNIEITSNLYAPFYYKIMTSNKVIIDKNIENKFFNLGFKDTNYSSLTFNPENEPKKENFIKGFSNEDGVYINQDFIFNNKINIDDINESSIVEFNIHVPIYYGTITPDVVYPSMTSFVHSVTLKKKIKGIVKTDNDLTKISNAGNLILYPINDCLDLMEKYSDINISKEISNKYTLSVPYPSAYFLTTESSKIQTLFNKFKIESQQYFKSINLNNHFALQSSYLQNQTTYEHITDIRTTMLNISLFLIYPFIILVFFFFIKSYRFLKPKQYVKNLLEQGLQFSCIFNYLKWKHNFLTYSFLILNFLSLVTVNTILKIIYPSIDTNIIFPFILGILFALYIRILLVIRLKNEKKILNSYKKLDQ